MYFLIVVVVVIVVVIDRLTVLLDEKTRTITTTIALATTKQRKIKKMLLCDTKPLNRIKRCHFEKHLRYRHAVNHKCIDESERSIISELEQLSQSSQADLREIQIRSIQTHAPTLRRFL